MIFGLLALLHATAFGSDVRVFNDDGGWCWFQDERVLVVNGKLVIGSVASGVNDAARAGDIEVTSVDLKTGDARRSTLHHPANAAQQKAWLDDHNSPAFVVRGDGRILAMYSRHGNEATIYYRISTHPDDATAWGDERTFVPTPASRVTYSNLHRLTAERNRIYDFFRGLDNSFKPSYAWSDDQGETWTSGNVFIDVPLKFRHRPYVKYASNGRDTVHIAYTEGHPRDFDNSIYHIMYRDGNLLSSDGKILRSMKEGIKSPEEGTLVFQGSPNAVAWTSDLHLDAKGRPVIAFSVQMNSAGKPARQGGEDHRYWQARWDGRKWQAVEVAHGGSRLYAGEDDYTGNIALDPHDPDIVYVSTNADPVTGAPLRVREIFRGRAHNGRNWRWTQVTRDSAVDNIRPIVPVWPGGRYALLWLRGTMTTYTNYRFEVVGFSAKR